MIKLDLLEKLLEIKKKMSELIYLLSDSDVIKNFKECDYGDILMKLDLFHGHLFDHIEEEIYKLSLVVRYDLKENIIKEKKGRVKQRTSIIDPSEPNKGRRMG